MLIKKNRIPIKHIILLGLFPSFLKIIIYRIIGYKIGKNVSIGLGSVIIGKEVMIGDNTTIGFATIIRARKIKLGRFIQIGSFDFLDTEVIEIDDDTRINEQVVVAGIKTPESILKVGKRSLIMEYSFLNPTKPLIIGNDAGIGGHCLLFTHSSRLSQLEGYPVTFSPISIGNNVWLPWRIFVMPGVSIGDNAVIGANSFVNSNIPSNCLAGGFPAKMILNDYPSKLGVESRSAILENIFKDFIEYLNYNDFLVIKNEIDKNAFTIKISKSKRSSELFYYNKLDLPIKYSNDNIIILDDESDSTLNYINNYKMVANLRLKERAGSSEIGEEFVAFISRYGIRFNRVD